MCMHLLVWAGIKYRRRRRGGGGGLRGKLIGRDKLGKAALHKFSAATFKGTVTQGEKTEQSKIPCYVPPQNPMLP